MAFHPEEQTIIIIYYKLIFFALLLFGDHYCTFYVWYLNIEQRDEAVANFREAIENQKIALKDVKSKIEGAKNDILGCQAEHEQLTGIHKRVHRLALAHQGAIKRCERLMVEEKLELGRLGRVRGESEVVLGRAETELRQLQAEEAGLRAKLESRDGERRRLEEELLGLLRDQQSTLRSSANTDRRVRELRQTIKELEAGLGESGNRLAELEGETAVARLRLEAEQQRISKLGLATKLLLTQEGDTKSSLEKTIVAIDKIQNLIDRGTKLKAELLAATGGEEISPLEADIKKHKEELNELINYCATAKRQWTKLQNSLIKAHIDKDESKQELEQSKNKFFILAEKKLSNEEEIRSLSLEFAKLKKRIENFDTNIKKLNTILVNERAKLEGMEDARVNKSEEMIAATTDLDEIIENLKESVQKLEVTRHFTVERVRESDKELFAWEDKVKACKETSGFLTEERARDGELETLKCEVHFLDQKLKEILRATGELSTSLEDHAIRRESIYLKINAERAGELEKKREKIGKTMTGKKIVDLKNDLKKLTRDIKQLELELEEAKASLAAVMETVGDLQDQVKQVGREIQQNGERTAAAQLERELRFQAVVHAQTKAKWYQGLK